MQIGREGIGKNTFKKHKYKKMSFCAFLLGNGLNRF